MAKQLKLYLITRGVGGRKIVNFDEYNGAVVVANGRWDAAKIHPADKVWDGKATNDWINMKQVDVEYLGVAKLGTKRGQILSSFFGG